VNARRATAVGVLVTLAEAGSLAAAVPANPDARPPSVYPSITALAPDVATSRFAMVVTNRPEASAAGAQVLEAGGNAVAAGAKR
jgi:gamma-glutamyltranspeptidase